MPLSLSSKVASTSAEADSESMWRHADAASTSDGVLLLNRGSIA